MRSWREPPCTGARLLDRVSFSQRAGKNMVKRDLQSTLGIPERCEVFASCCYTSYCGGRRVAPPARLDTCDIRSAHLAGSEGKLDIQYKALCALKN